MKDSTNEFENPLVTILIITYNSSEFIWETLESAKNQDYKNIELIISDDGSTDETIEVIKAWGDQNFKHFVNAKLVTTEINTGITANCNRGLREANGKWIKLIAGDDILADFCISENLHFISKNNFTPKLVISQVTTFTDSDSIDHSNVQPRSQKEIFRSDVTAERQHYLLIRGTFILGSSAFYNRDVLTEMGGFNEEFRSLEDYPTFLYFTKKGFKLFFLPKSTVYYRRHQNAVGVLKQKEVLAPYYLDISNLMVRYGKRSSNSLLYANSLWNQWFIRKIFKFGNKGKVSHSLNLIRIHFAPIRIRGIANKLGFK